VNRKTYLVQLTENQHRLLVEAGLSALHEEVTPPIPLLSWKATVKALDALKEAPTLSAQEAHYLWQAVEEACAGWEGDTPQLRGWARFARKAQHKLLKAGRK